MGKAFIRAQHQKEIFHLEDHYLWLFLRGKDFKNLPN
jgi:hypothetical protein